MNGVRVIELSSWEEFRKEVTKLTDSTKYIWRGQERDKPLKSLFDRSFENLDKKVRSQTLEQRLKRFKEEMNQSHPHVLPENEDDIWALGQHYGLKTPFLDWTLSPYIAAYFAFEKTVDQNDQNDKYRYVYALKKRFKRLVKKLKQNGMVLSRKQYVEIIDVKSLKHLSPRFLVQKGIFTKALNGDDIETNVKRWSRKRPVEVTLVKFKIPTKDRVECLRELHLMNINYESLLLDLHDVVDKCNN